MKNKFPLGPLSFAILCGLLGNAVSAQMLLNTSEQGHVSVGPYSLGFTASDPSYQLGPDPASSMFAVPFFQFDIPDLSAGIESIKFSLYNPGDVTYGSPAALIRDQGVVDNGQPPFEVKLWDYTGDPAQFMSDYYTYFGPDGPDDTPWGETIDDLRSGAEYGSAMVDSSQDGAWIDFYLTEDALADVMASQGGKFTMGAWQENLKTAFYGEPGFEAQSGYQGAMHPQAQLEIQFRAGGTAVPEPSTYGIFASVAVSMGILVRHLRGKA